MHVSVTTPRGSLLESEVEELSAPGELGEFGVLPGHIPFISALKPGVFLCRTGGSVKALAVGSGILQVGKSEGGERVVVLVDEATNAGDIDREQVAHDLAQLDRDIAQWKGEAGGELAALMARRAWAQAQLDAATRTGDG